VAYERGRKNIEDQVTRSIVSAMLDWLHFINVRHIVKYL
jgi:hypothetical protein